MTDDLGRLRDWLSLAQSRTDWNQFGAIFKINKSTRAAFGIGVSKTQLTTLPLIDVSISISNLYDPCLLRSLSKAPIARRKHPVLMTAKYLIYLI
jgi:hypothetical protein